MLVIKVWGLPKQAEEELRVVHSRIVEAAKSAGLSSIKTEKDLMVWFPMDLMRYGLGEQIVVEISFTHPIEFKAEYNLADEVGKALLGLFPRAEVCCLQVTGMHNLWLSSEYEASGIPM